MEINTLLLMLICFILGILTQWVFYFEFVNRWYAALKPKKPPTVRKKSQEYYTVWWREAKRKGWSIPRSSTFDQEAWLAHWKACQDYEDNPQHGRPVVPHRT